MKTLTWQKPGQHFVAQELIKIIINYVAELRGNKKFQIGIIENNTISWNKDELKKWHTHDVTSLSCKYCKYVFLCGGGCLAMKTNQCNLFKKMIIKAVNTVYNSVYANLFNK